MSFCCGASMLGGKGTLRHIRTRIHNVPLLLCPICQRVQVHHSAISEYEILAEYAHGDGATDVDFSDYVDQKQDSELFENCVNYETEGPEEVLQSQIDMSLDLLALANQIGDEEWQEQLKRRLKVLSVRRAKLKSKK